MHNREQFRVHVLPVKYSYVAQTSGSWYENEYNNVCSFILGFTSAAFDQGKNEREKEKAIAQMEGIIAHTFFPTSVC